MEGLKEVGEGEDSRVSIEGSGGAGKKEMGDAAVAGRRPPLLPSSRSKKTDLLELGLRDGGHGVRRSRRE